jgi:hypothetical protein
MQLEMDISHKVHELHPEMSLQRSRKPLIVLPVAELDMTMLPIAGKSHQDCGLQISLFKKSLAIRPPQK